MKNSIGEREFYKDMRYSWEIRSEPILKPVRIKNYKITKKYEKGHEPCYCIPTNCSLVRGQGKFFPGISLLLS